MDSTSPDAKPLPFRRSSSSSSSSRPRETATISINLDTSSEDDFALTPEQQAEQKRVQDREKIVAPIIDRIIPSRTLEQIQRTARRKFSHMGEEYLDAHAKKGLQKDEEQKSDLISSIARTKITESDLEQYASSLYFMAKDLSPASEGVEPYLVGTFVNATETVEQGVLYQHFAQKWKEKFLTNVNDATIGNRSRDFVQILGELSTNRYSQPEPRPQKEITELLDAFIEVYEVAYSLPSDEQNKKIFQTLTKGATGIGIQSHDVKQTERLLQIFKDTAQKPDRVLLERFVDSVSHYGSNHGLTEGAGRGLVEKLLPAMEAHDPQVAMLQRAGNMWGMKKGDFGAADFICHAYALKISPPNINELLMVAREVPTTDLARLEQNRLDGLTLAAPFGALRDFIHDQRPYVHDVIKAMVDYYDTGNKGQLLSILAKADPGYLGGTERQAAILDKDKYDIETTERRKDGNPQEEKVKPIDVLRRLEKNTRPTEEKAPITSDQEFNTLLQSLEVVKTGKSSLLQAVDYANSKLIAQMKGGDIGIEPAHILAYAWLERQAFGAIQGLTYEDQVGAYKQPWFHSVLRFQELTGSPSDFNEEEFQQFLTQVLNAESAKAAYQKIFQRTLGNISKLTGKYKDEGRDNRIGALWSGNTAHELIGLTDLRVPETAYGIKHRGEKLKPEDQRLNGD